MEKIWHYIFYNALKIPPEECPLIMSEEIGNTPDRREKLAQIMFETFNVPYFYLDQSSMFSLYSSGRTTGTVLNMGHSKNDVCCILDGTLLPKGEISHIAGHCVTDELYKRLAYSEQYLGKLSPEDVKEKYCFISQNIYNQEVLFQDYVLPDGNVILGKERYLAPEILFDTSTVGGELTIQELVSNCIKSKDGDLKDEFYKNIVLSGGGSLLEGLPERISKELMKFHSNKINVIAPPNRKYSTWMGASLFGMMKSFQKEWIDHMDYEEFGPSIINSRCFNNVQSNHVYRQQSEFSRNLSNLGSKSTDFTFKSE
jgi:actin, other eukaryote